MNTIVELFENRVNLFPNNTLLKEKKAGSYQSTTYYETREQVYQFAAGLLSIGLEKNDRVALLAEGRNDWLISELAVLYCGAINVPLSVKLDAETDLKFRLLHSETKIIIVSKHHVAKIRQIVAQLPLIEQIIILDEVENLMQLEISKSEICQLGDIWLKTKRHELEQRCRAIIGDDYANISYTSGTTADPKGIILSHRNYVANVEQASTLMEFPENYVTLAVLPWDHAFAHTACLYAFMWFGAAIASTEIGKTPMETLKNIPLNIKETCPHVMMSVPALAKNFRKGIETGIKAKSKVTESLFNFALNVSYSYNGLGFNKGKGIRFLLKPLHNLFDKILYTKIRAGFGGNLQLFIGGGALLDLELQRFFYAIGIPMLQGYGLSEASPIISANSMKRHKLGSSGFLVKNLELKIIDDKGNSLPPFEKGEILVKGDNVMKGYWRNATATAETLRDGWLYTGDLGYVDNDGFLYVFGRFKSLLIGSDGEKYSPEGIEEAIIENSTYIDQIMLHNNQNAYTTAIVVVNKQAINRLLNEKSHAIQTEEGQKIALEQIKHEIDKFKSGGHLSHLFPLRWLPTTILIAPTPFTEENKMINSTMKMVRGKIEERYKSELEFLYTPNAKNIVNDLNIKYLNTILS